MMTLPEFRKHLLELDAMYQSLDAQMFHCEVRQEDETTFSYCFDGIVPVIVRFNPTYGDVRCWEDCTYEDIHDPEGVIT